MQFHPVFFILNNLTEFGQKLEIELHLFLFVDLVFLDQIQSIWTVQSYPLVF